MCQLNDQKSIADVNKKELAERLTSPASGKKISTYPYYIKDNYIMKYPDTEGGKPILIGRLVQIAEIKQDIDKKTVTLVLRYLYREEIREIEISRGDLTKFKIHKLLTYGVDVSDHKATEVLKYLMMQENYAPLISTHNQIGFAQIDGKQVFKHYKTIGYESTYNGPLLLEPKGTEEEWTRLVRTHIIGHSPLELALAIGFSAPVSSLIAKETGLEVLVFHIWGNSSQGKTTATRVAVSPFGSPQTTEGGLIKSWNGTTNAILAQLRNNHGIPMAFDEASMQNGDFTNLVYMLASGEERGRLNKNSELKENSQWSGVILSNAEHSISSKSSKNTGIQMRLTELGSIPWTDSAKHADFLKEGLLKNYGHTGPKFVRYLMNVGNEYVLDCWRKWKKICMGRIENPDNFASRIADKIAVILTTAELVNESLQLGLNGEGISEILLSSVEEKKDSRDLSEKAYQYFLEAVFKNKSKFSKSDNATIPAYEHWGKVVVENNKWKEVYILRDQFKKIMADGEFENKDVILKLWRDNGLLDHEVNKLSKKKRINGTQLAVHVVRIREEISDTIEAEDELEIQTTQGVII